MATTSQAQEELRRIRAAQAEEADRQKVIDDAEKAEQERKAAFAARKAAFGGSQKPTDEEVKEEIQKAAAKRKFTRQLTRQLTSGSAGGTSFSRDAGDGDSDWQFVDQGKLAPSYYWNRVTNEITYENPFEAKSETSDDVSKGWTKVPASGDQPEYYWNSVSGESAFELPAGASVQEADESSQWTSGVDEGSGLTYYYNYVTGTTQWAVPACLKPPADGSADDAANWTSGVDEASGYTYYCNIVTCETQWERPACLDSTSPAEILPSVEDPAVAEERNPAVAEDATVPEKAGPASDVAPSPAPPAPASNPTSPTIDRPPPPPPPPKPPAQEGSAGSLQPPPPPPPRRQASEEQTQAKPQRRMTGFALPGMGTMTIHQAMKRATTPPGPIVAKSEEQACTIDPVGAETDTPSKPLPEISMKPDNSDAQGDDTEAPGDKANVAGDGSDAPGDDSELPGGKADVAVTTAVNGRESMVRIAEDNQEEAESSDDECNDFVEAPERMTEMSSAERPTADFTDRPTSLAITEIRTLDNLREDMTTEELKVAVGDITFDYYADNFFIYERKGLFKSKSTASKMLQWKNELIKMPLRKLSSPDLHKAALQLFRNVTGFMGDRKSSKPKEDHAEKILSYAIRFNQELHDEIFLQICKQLTKNPSPASVKQGWELTTLCLSVFPPSPELLYPLLSFFSSNLTSSDSDVAKYAAFCMHSCLKRARLGVKSVDEVPTMAEMSTIWTL